MITKQKFGKLKFPLYDLENEPDLLSHLPELNKHAEFRKIPKSRSDAVIKYLILLYDPQSHLLKEYHDLKERKEAALVLANIPKWGKGYADYVDDMVNLTDPIVLNAVMCLLVKVYHNRKYTEWQTLQQELEEYTRRRLNLITAKDDKDEMAALEKKAKLRVECQNINDQLDGMEKDIFGNDDELKEIVKQLRFDTPENFVKSFS
jgi:hypothetical protein